MGRTCWYCGKEHNLRLTENCPSCNAPLLAYCPHSDPISNILCREKEPLTSKKCRYCRCRVEKHEAIPVHDQRRGKTVFS